jgi:flavin-dependent dehydrogenase
VGADERVDVVVVGARCAGSAAASILARAGRDVLVLDRARFPSDTLSTHLMFPNGCAELKRIGAWPRIRDQIRPAQMRRLRITLDDGVECEERFRAVDGIDHGISIPRIQLDELLVDNARRLGAEVRERSTVEELRWRGGRATGVCYRDSEGRRRQVGAQLVIGADGRRSTVSALTGAWRPYRASRNGRGLVFSYMDDPAAGSEAAETMWQWRDDDSLAFAFPNPDGRILVLFMADRAEVADARSDPDSYWERKLAQHPGCARRIAGADNQTKLRSTGEAVAFFRASSGPGWALAGDAGHFKDPVIGQGMRDALWMGRTLAEVIVEAPDEPAALDRALRQWEAERDAECLPAYHFANAETVARHYSPVLSETLRRYGGDAGRPEIGDLFQRLRTPQEVLSLPRLARSLAGAVRRGPERARVLREGLGEAAVELRIRRELSRHRFRETRTVAGSDHPGWEWPAAPLPAERRQPIEQPEPEAVA